MAEKYICPYCGRQGDEQEECCNGQQMEAACSCGSGKPASVAAVIEDGKNFIFTLVKENIFAILEFSFL